MTEIRRIIGAFKFLTLLPLPLEEELEGSSAYFPLVGWFIGIFLYLIWTVMAPLPLFIQAFLTIFIWELLSRGLHIDALADTADAFMAGGSRERILKIMEDSKIGAFGILAIVLLILGKFSVISSSEWESTRAALVCAPVLARYFLTLSAFLFKPAKDRGLGSLIISSTGIKGLLIATLIGYLPVFIIFERAALYSTVAFVFPFSLLLYSRWKLGGLNGDVLGAALEITELMTLVAFLPLFYT
jgi:adenosylcobinamide-GDP ribazoletransferase